MDTYSYNENLSKHLVWSRWGGWPRHQSTWGGWPPPDNGGEGDDAGADPHAEDQDESPPLIKIFISIFKNVNFRLLDIAKAFDVSKAIPGVAFGLSNLFSFFWYVCLYLYLYVCLTKNILIVYILCIEYTRRMNVFFNSWTLLMVNTEQG